MKEAIEKCNNICPSNQVAFERVFFRDIWIWIEKSVGNIKSQILVLPAEVLIQKIKCEVP